MGRPVTLFTGQWADLPLDDLARKAKEFGYDAFVPGMSVRDLTGADFVGLDEFVQKIEGGWVDVDVIIATPSVMPKIGKLGKVLGPRNLMPNPKTGTVTNEVGKAVNEVKAGKIDFKVDKQGSIHASVGKASFDAKKIEENASELINAIIKLKPAAAKGTYMKSVYMSSTMSPSVQIDTKSLS